MELYNLTIHELHDKLKNKEISSLELTEIFLKRIGAVDSKIKAYITVTAEEAIKQALRQLKAKRSEVQIKIVSEEERGLFGMPGAKPAKIRVTLIKN